MKTLEGQASDILKEWVDGRYDIYYKYDGDRIFQIEIYEKETQTSYRPSVEVEHYLEIILNG